MWQIIKFKIMNEIIKNEIVELTTTEKTEVATIFVTIMNAIKSDIQNS
jgi:hypothetical protein